ncbi:MAG: hypothetical protein DWP95_13285 [Proteobacteria bacterium]|nr:MAG: hypothetical protein DWP95_13285 [Pseudomonadota bacterium]
MKLFSVIVTGEPACIKGLISCISYDPVDLISHQFSVDNSDETKDVDMIFGALPVDEDHRIDLFGGNDEALFEFIDERPDSPFKGLIITLDADDSKALSLIKDRLIKQQSYLHNYALVVGVYGSEYSSIKQAEEQVRKYLTELNAVAPVLSIDPNNKEDVNLLVESLLCFASPGIQDNYYGKPSFDLGDDPK